MFGCLNANCCSAMISYVKSKFNFLAAFCIVAFFFLLVAILTSRYMYKKIKKYNNVKVLSHSKDKVLFLLMILCTIGLGLWLGFGMPEVPQSQPKPDPEMFNVDSDFYSMYDIRVDRVIGIGSLSEDGWWNFE